MPSRRTTKGRRTILLQDGAPPHKARITQQLIQESGYKTFDWPAQSADLNPIEHGWKLIGDRLKVFLFIFILKCSGKGNSNN